jgi:hypothetical protein
LDEVAQQIQRANEAADTALTEAADGHHEADAAELRHGADAAPEVSAPHDGAQTRDPHHGAETVAEAAPETVDPHGSDDLDLGPDADPQPDRGL